MRAVRIFLVLFVWLSWCKGNAERSNAVNHAHEHEEQSQHAHGDTVHTHEEETDHVHGEKLKIDERYIKEFGIKVSVAREGKIRKRFVLPGEVKLNVDRVAHVVARVSGIVVRTFAGVGDRVREGQVLALISSRELARLKSNYLSALEKAKIAKRNWERERELWKKGISSEREYLEAKREWEIAKIELKTARQKLLAIGFSPSYIKKLPEEPEEKLALFEVRAPIGGTVVEKHAVVGEFKRADDTLFKIVDTSVVWIDFAVWQEHIPFVRVGQPVRILVDDTELEGKISWVSPILDPKTRTAIARVELKNPGFLSAGMFVSGIFEVEVPVKVAVPEEAVVRIKDKLFVFVEKDGYFEPRKVKVGVEGGGMVQILEGLEVGERYVSSGAFFLKSEILKEEFAGEGHAH